MHLNDEDQAAVAHAISVLSSNLRDRGADPRFLQPSQAVSYIRLLIGPREVESFVILYLDARYRLIETTELNTGTVDETSAHPRAVIKRGLDNCARFIVVAHNHPSGDPHPSDADIELTKRLAEASDLFDITLLDHYVVGRAPGFPVYSIASQRTL